jgi:tyrosinase
MASHDTQTDSRKNARDLSSDEWNALVDAINRLHGTGAASPAYRDFVALHVQAMSMGGMSWGVHFMPNMNMDGRNFLVWHRRFVQVFEERLQQVHSSIAMPYWDWVNDRTLPTPLSQPALLRSWSVRRNFNPSFLPSAAALQSAVTPGDFLAFQLALEKQHDQVHFAVGGRFGTMNSASSPADPIFFLHHANIDRLWSEWEASHPGVQPPNPNEVLEPGEIIGNVTVATQLSITGLGYRYA